MEKNEQDFTWLDKVIDIHRKHGLKEIDIHKLRKISKKDAIEASKYLYKDYLANVGKVKGAYNESFGSQLEQFDINEKERAIGALFEIIDKCQKKEGYYSDIMICNIKDIKKIAKEWNLNPAKLIRAYTKEGVL